MSLPSPVARTEWWAGRRKELPLLGPVSVFCLIPQSLQGRGLHLEALGASCVVPPLCLAAWHPGQPALEEQSYCPLAHEIINNVILMSLCCFPFACRLSRACSGHLAAFPGGSFIKFPE